ncbi:MAG TPA: choice-of-anchor L domain-containing protein [Edaphocola sp.]|nr:choice-of-anchor L domain-containing protein [Edaphocola sp.]
MKFSRSIIPVSFFSFLCLIIPLTKVFAQATVSVSGKVYNDVNGLTDNNINGNGVDSGFIQVLLINDSTNKVVAKMRNGAGGVFAFNSVGKAPYSVRLTNATASVGQAPPGVVLPSNWVSVGEYFGSGTGHDAGSPDSKLTLDSVLTDVVNARLGIEQRPETKRDTVNSYYGNTGGTTFYDVDNFAFGGHDSSGGHMDSIRIVSFPTHTTTLRINGVNYSATSFPVGGIRIKSDYNGVPSGTIQVDPEDGIFMVKITYATIDNAHVEDITPGAVYVPFSVKDDFTAQELVQYLTGTGVTVLNPQLNGTCPTTARGKFNFFGPNDLGIDSGIVLTTGRVVTSSSSGPYGVNGPVGYSPSNSFPGTGLGDATLDSLLASTGSTVTTNDACALEFDFVPAGDTIKFDYVFGSDEYPTYDCTIFNDVFGFFIYGNGYSGLNNIALVPGTSIPVAINSINGEDFPEGTDNPCTDMGNGSPFTQYYVNNLTNGGQQITYNGFTVVLTAIAAVIPCDTYHLKLAIGDGSDHVLDSGVFLKAGSLNSTGIIVKTFGGAGLETPYTNTVRGCPPGVVRISRNGGFSQPVTIPLQFSGTAVNGTDYVSIPSTVTIPAGDSAVTINVSGIPVFPPVGPKTCIISAVSPYTCGNGQPLFLSSDTITILDSIYVNILNPDTAICYGESVDLKVQADSVVDFHWTPAGTVSDSIAKNVTVTPDSTTTYRVSVKLPSSLGCPASSDTVRIDVKRQPHVDLGPDVFTCADTVQLNAHTSPDNPDESYSWSPATGLNNSSIANPVATVAGEQTYVLTVNPGAIGCDGKDSIKITVLPDHIDLLQDDTVVCQGTTLQLFVDGDNHFDYNWAPALGIANDTAKNTTVVAQQSALYSVTASYPTCPPMSDSFYLEVQPVPVVNAGPDRTICSYDTIQLYASVMPSGYGQYAYEWSPSADLTNPGIKNPVFSGDHGRTQVVTVRTPIGCTGKDSLMITVNPGDFLAVSPVDTGFCPPDGVQMNATGAVQYVWSPGAGLTDPGIANPFAQPQSSTEYTLIAKSIAGCYDTAKVYIQVYPSAVIDLPDSVQIWPGESYQIHPNGNALYFSWFPPSGLSADNISDPVASPSVRTRYFVTAKTENGCIVKDSIDVLVNTTPVYEAPNAFAPGSGPNGVFKIEKRGFVKLKSFTVYNRWGNKVFETDDINRGWDGSFNGKPQPAGVYVYVIEAYADTGALVRKTGNVTLIR